MSLETGLTAGAKIVALQPGWRGSDPAQFAAS